MYESEKEIFIWNTHRLHITDMLSGVTGLHAIYGREPRGGCGGGEYNRTFMSMTTELRDKLLLIARDGNRTVLPTWRETHDPNWDWRPSGCGGSNQPAQTYSAPRTTSSRAVHVTELRERIDALRRRFGLARFNWTDSTIVPEVTPVRAVHLNELRTALDEAYRAAARDVPSYTDAQIVRYVTPVRLVHMTELRQAVVALEE